MPYIKDEFADSTKTVKKREALSYKSGWDDGPTDPGELNFVITDLCNDFMERDKEWFGYGAINEVIGVLECVKLELYRRVAVPYEDKKIKENGDVYD